jgi:GntR family transcriptional regulator, galactonate operon transcriptional repressor
VSATFARIVTPERLHARVTRTLALRILHAEHDGEPGALPNEADLCLQLGVSRTVIREAIKVLAAKGMLEVRQGSGTRARPRSEWSLLDPDVLAWQALLAPDPRVLRDICEVRLAIEPIASGFAALRATPREIAEIERRLEAKEAGATDPEQAVDADLRFHAAVVAASHNPLLEQLSAVTRQPFRMALSYTRRLRAAEAMGLAAHRELVEAIKRRDPLKARAAAEEIVGLAMVGVEEAIRSERRRKPRQRLEKPDAS